MKKFMLLVAAAVMLFAGMGATSEAATVFRNGPNRTVITQRGRMITTRQHNHRHNHFRNHHRHVRF